MQFTWLHDAYNDRLTIIVRHVFTIQEATEKEEKGKTFGILSDQYDPR